MRIALLNCSTLVPDREAELIAQAIDLQLREHVSQLWDTANWTCTFFPGAKVAPQGFIPLVLFDDADAAGCLGYHDRGPDGRPYGKVFVRIILNAGGGILVSAKRNGDTVASVTSHEADEIVGDADANIWCDGPFFDWQRRVRWASVARELADPVQEQSYEVTVKDGTKVAVSNFVGPEWFDCKSKGERYDWLGSLKAPLTLAPGGYCIVRNQPGTEAQVFAAQAPSAWRAEMKQHAAARAAIRGSIVLPEAA